MLKQVQGQELLLLAFLLIQWLAAGPDHRRRINATPGGEHPASTGPAIEDDRAGGKILNIRPDVVSEVDLDLADDRVQ